MFKKIICTDCIIEHELLRMNLRYVIPQSLIQFYPENGIQINTRVLYCFSALCIFKTMLNNPEFRQFILQVQSGVIYFYNLNNNF